MVSEFTWSTTNKNKKWWFSQLRDFLYNFVLPDFSFAELELSSAWFRMAKDTFGEVDIKSVDKPIRINSLSTLTADTKGTTFLFSQPLHY